MTWDVHDEITLELARLERAALERVRKRNAEQQLGEAWAGLVAGEAGVEPTHTVLETAALGR